MARSLCSASLIRSDSGVARTLGEITGGVGAEGGGVGGVGGVRDSASISAKRKFNSNSECNLLDSREEYYPDFDRVGDIERAERTKRPDDSFDNQINGWTGTGCFQRLVPCPNAAVCQGASSVVSIDQCWRAAWLHVQHTCRCRFSA